MDLEVLPASLKEKMFVFQYVIYTVNLYNIIYIIEKGNGNLLQYSCLENPMDREAW